MTLKQRIHSATTDDAFQRAKREYDERTATPLKPSEVPAWYEYGFHSERLFVLAVENAIYLEYDPRECSPTAALVILDDKL